MTKNTLDHFVSQVVEKPQVFFSSNQKIVDSALEMAKHFYDDVKRVEQVQFSPFTELLTEGFDNDQIWEEIASQNEPFLNYAKTTLKQLNKKPAKEPVYSEDESMSDHSMALEQHMDSDEDMEDVDQEEEELDQSELEQDEEDEEDEELDPSEDDQNVELEEEEQEEEEMSEGEDEEEAPATKKKAAASEVDDEFFNLEEFNKWTDKQEELDMMSDREDQDDDFDFDNDMAEEEDSEEEDADAAELTFNDFFGTDEKPRTKKPYTPKKKIEYEEELVDSEEEEEEDESEIEDVRSEGSVRDLFGGDDSEEEGEKQDKSAFQKQQERLAAQIEEYEDENVQDKHWTLRGEATAKARPVNSLLEEDLEFEHANKPVPVITQESTNTLEDMIKKRILDNMFDDVVRKVDPTLRPFIPSKRVEISDEKAKQSLADMYEDDFVRKQGGSEKVDARDEALEKEHGEITELFKTLCHKLDALSNFHYTPKAAKPEMSIVSNSAAISMEEVTPVNVSDATLLAPEEVYDKKRNDVKTAAEMDQDERKRMRAQKKKLKRKERDMKERELKVMQKYNPQAGQRQAKTKAVKELLGQKNVTVIGKDGQQKTTSKAVTSASLF